MARRFFMTIAGVILSVAVWAEGVRITPSKADQKNSGSRPNQKSATRTGPETLSLDSLYPKKKILSQAASMTSQPEVLYSTAGYAAQFEDLMKAVRHTSPSPKSWSETEKQVLLQVPEPTEGAFEALNKSRAEGEALVEARVKQVEVEYRKEVAEQLEREKLLEKQRQAVIREEQRREAIAAENRKAEAMEAQAQAINNNAAAIHHQNHLLYHHLY